MKQALLLFLIIQSVFVFAQTEEQRKYVFKNIDDATRQTIGEGAVLNGLTIKKHSVYEYSDLYLDTADLDVMKNKMSLRIRKRDYGNGKIEYGMQLKSEMLKPGDIRMEIDEVELDYLKVLYKGDEIKLLDVLKNIYTRFADLSNDGSDIASDEIIKENVSILGTWLSFKSMGALAPFQKLRRLNFSAEKLATLRAYVIGKSVRTRSHVYIDRTNSVPELAVFPQSARDQDSTPDRIKGQNFVWTMEASYDQARFHSLLKAGAFHDINEFEVENKYLPHENAVVLLQRFEGSLIKELGAEINLESKYLQTMKALGY